MPFLIQRLSGSIFFDAQQFEYYFFDSNSWIYFLKSQHHPVNPKDPKEEILYANLFTQIVNLNLLTGIPAKKIKVKPKIIVTSLLLAELINAFMRQVAMREYFADKGIECNMSKFKKEYRNNPETDYKKQLRRFINDFNSFKDIIQLQDDDFINIDPYSILQDLPNHDADFNDFYYYYTFSGKNVAIVTHDGDFRFPDIPIITANEKLIKLS